MSEPRRFSYDSMGTGWAVTVWDEIENGEYEHIRSSVIRDSEAFDRLYSRFIDASLVWQLAKTTGIAEVPYDMVIMLRLYERLHALSDGKCNPLVGFTLSDLGYDANYSLQAKKEVRPTPRMENALRIVDDTHIELMKPALIDVGALGKGFMVDKIAAFLDARGIGRYLVDGSGDIRYRGNGEPIRAGLEHPDDPTKVIGVATMTDGALCASATNRRAWGNRHHIIDPTTGDSPRNILATWVMAEEAAVADGLATCLFFTEPERYEGEFEFEYCILNTEYKMKKSKNFSNKWSSKK